MWARQLLRRIEAPMQRFAGNKALMAAKESRRVIRLYNRVAKALVEFEALWHAACLKVRFRAAATRSSLSHIVPLIPATPPPCSAANHAQSHLLVVYPQGIDAQKAGLSAPLLVRHPDSGHLLVNLDRDVMTLIR